MKQDRLAGETATFLGEVAALADTSGHLVPLTDFLAKLAKVPEAERMQLLWEDQRQRWQGGERTPVEDYLRGLPAVSEEVILDLIYGEHVLRQENMDTGGPSDQFSVRFPDLAKKIHRQHALHECLSSPEITGSFANTKKPAPSAPAATCPEEIAGYRVVALLDGGGQGSIYRGVHSALGRDVVIKLGRPCAATSRDAELLIKEGQILAELDHPGLARVFDLKFHEGRPCLVMEFIRGCNLEQDASRNRRTPREAASLVARIARAVAMVHQKGIVHRDLKPKNIMIDEAGNPRLIDFGLALLEDAWRTDADKPGLCGTLAYMAPEQARAEAVTPQTDIFALGGILFFLLTGEAPYNGVSVTEVYEKAQRCQWNRPKLLDRPIPPRLQAIVEKAMAADPAARHASADEIAAELETAVRPASRWPWWAAGIGAAAALLVGVMLWLNPFPGPGSNPPGPNPPGPNANPDDKKKAEPRPFSLDVRVWRGKRYAELRDAVPLKNRDEVRVQSVAPAAMHSALFYVNQAGQVKLLASAASPDADSALSFPNELQRAAPLTGKAGNEYVFLLARRSGPITAGEVEEALGKISHWPSLPLDSVLGVSPSAVKVLQPGRDLGPLVDRPDPEGEVKQALEALQTRLAARFEHFEGLAFSRGE